MIQNEQLHLGTLVIHHILSYPTFSRSRFQYLQLSA